MNKNELANGIRLRYARYTFIRTGRKACAPIRVRALSALGPNLHWDIGTIGIIGTLRTLLIT